MATPKCTPKTIAAFLHNGPATAATVISHFQTSQSTFSRLSSAIPSCIAIGASRARQYGIRRRIFGIEDDIPVYQISSEGHIHLKGELIPLEGNAYVFYTDNRSHYEIFHGLPFFLSDLRPQGFLGRMVPQNNSNLNLPESIIEWTDDDVLRFLVSRGESLAGDILIGGQSYLRHINNLARHPDYVESKQRHALYPSLAESTMKGGTPGSSAGGEQPKFVTTVRSDASAYQHVIVKFSPPVASTNGRR